MIVPLSTKFTKDLHTYTYTSSRNEKIIIGNNNTQNNLRIVM